MKTISMSIEETNRKLVDTINESGLPFSVIELMLKDILTQVSKVAKEETQKDMTNDAIEQAEKQLAEEQKAKEQEKKEDTKETK